MKKYAIEAVLQLITVAVGVFLGVVASDWREERNQRAQQEEFLANLYQEISANRKKMEGTLAYHTMIIETSDRQLKELSQDILEKGFFEAGQWNLIPGWRGIENPILESAVYESGIIRNTFSDLDFTLISRVAQVYNFQKEYRNWYQMLIYDQMTETLKKDDATTSEVLSMISDWSDITNIDRGMLDLYDSAMVNINPMH